MRDRRYLPWPPTASVQSRRLAKSQVSSANTVALVFCEASLTGFATTDQF